MVRLRVVWDKRVILMNCSKLKDYGQRIFIAPDESLEARRKRMVERIKSRAELEGKSVVLADGILMVDGVSVFSLKDGKINLSHG